MNLTPILLQGRQIQINNKIITMQRYIDNAIIWDFIVIIIISLCLFLGQSVFEEYLKNSTIENLTSFGTALITVCASLVGFFLTIITVIVTFKKGFEQKENNKITPEPTSKIPRITVFDKKISKDEKFYGTPIHKRVVQVFINAAFEIGFVLFVLLITQMNIISLSLYWTLNISFCIFILILLSTFRSLYIFKLFLRVHLK